MRFGRCGSVASDCPLASIQIGQATGTRPSIRFKVLARAYRADVSDAVEAPKE